VPCFGPALANTSADGAVLGPRSRLFRITVNKPLRAGTISYAGSFFAPVLSAGQQLSSAAGKEFHVTVTVAGNVFRRSGTI